MEWGVGVSEKRQSPNEGGPVQRTHRICLSECERECVCECVCVVVVHTFPLLLPASVAS